MGVVSEPAFSTLRESYSFGKIAIRDGERDIGRLPVLIEARIH
jgi:hypothetical protein